MPPASPGPSAPSPARPRPGFTQSVTYSPTDVTLDLVERRRPDHRHPDQRHDLHGAQHRRAPGGAAGQWRAAHPYGRAASRHRQPQGADRAGRHRRRRRWPSPAPPISSPICCRQIPQAVGQMGGWFKAIGSFASLDGSISTPGFDTQAGGFLAGFDKAFSPNLTGGIALGYLHTNLSEAGGASGRSTRRGWRSTAPTRWGISPSMPRRAMPMTSSIHRGPSPISARRRHRATTARRRMRRSR